MMQVLPLHDTDVVKEKSIVLYNSALVSMQEKKAELCLRDSSS